MLQRLFRRIRPQNQVEMEKGAEVWNNKRNKAKGCEELKNEKRAPGCFELFYNCRGLLPSYVGIIRGMQDPKNQL